MSPTDADEREMTGHDGSFAQPDHATSRYRTLPVGDDQLIIYDTDRQQWIQSDNAVSREVIR